MLMKTTQQETYPKTLSYIEGTPTFQTPAVQVDTLKLLQARTPEHWDKVFVLLTSPSWAVQLRTLNLLDKIPDELIATYFYKLCPVLHSKDSIRDSSRRMLEQEVSADILAEHFHKIVPPLLADPELLPWSFDFLRGRIVERLVPELIDVIFSILCRTGAAWSGEEEALLEFMKALLPSELAAAHVNHIVEFLARPDLKVELRCWTLDLLCEAAGTPHFAEHAALGQGSCTSGRSQLRGATASSAFVGGEDAELSDHRAVQ